MILGVHTFAWAISIGVSSRGSIQFAPITPQGIEAQSLSAGVADAIATSSVASTTDTTDSQFGAQ